MSLATAGMDLYAESALSGSPLELEKQSPAASDHCRFQPLILLMRPLSTRQHQDALPCCSIFCSTQSTSVRSALSGIMCMSVCACGDLRGSHPVGWSLWWYWTCATASSRVMSYSSHSGVETLRDSSDSSRSAAQTGEEIKMHAW